MARSELLRQVGSGEGVLSVLDILCSNAQLLVEFRRKEESVCRKLEKFSFSSVMKLQANFTLPKPQPICSSSGVNRREYLAHLAAAVISLMYRRRFLLGALYK